MILALPQRESKREAGQVRGPHVLGEPKPRGRMRLRHIILGICGLILVLLLALPVIVNTNTVKSYIVGRVSDSTGREVELNGPLHLRLFRWPPAIEAHAFKFGNPKWAKSPEMLDLPNTSVVIDLFSVLFGNRVKLPEISLHKPTVVLEKNAQGVANWTLKEKDEKTEPDDDSPVSIGSLTVDQGVLKYSDQKSKTDVEVQVETSTDADGQPTVRFKGSGKFKGMPAKIEGSGGPVLNIHDETTPYPLDGTVTIGATTAAVKGTITGLAKFAAADLQLDLRGASMDQLFPILGITLPPTPKYRVRGHLVREGKVWSFAGFNGTVGESDLNGDFKVDVSGEKPLVNATLVSRLLDLKDLGGFVGQSPGKKDEDPEHVVPESEWRSERLRAMNADVRFEGKSIRGMKNPVDNLKFHLKLHNGMLVLDPLDFGIAKGDIVSKVRLDASKDRIGAKIDGDFRKIHLAELFPGSKMLEQGFGIIGGRMKLEGRGNSPSALLASSNGVAGLATTGGEISEFLMELTALNGGELLRLLFEGDDQVTLRCAVAQFKVTQGVLEPEFLVVDTEDVAITASGTIDLASEKLDHTVYPESKSPGILSMRSPIEITGTFADPTIIPDPKGLIIRGGIATLLGFATPIAALAAFVEPGTGEDQPCAALIRTVKSQSQIKESSMTSPSRGG